MIDTHEVFLMGEGQYPQFKMEVNWNLNDKETNHCQVVRFTFPDGQKSYVKREHLHSVLFAIGKAAQQRDLIPQKHQTIRNIETVLGIKATKDIRKGEMINVPVKIPIPISQWETIGRAPKPSKLLTPKF